MLVCFKLTRDKLRFNFEYFEPQNLAFCVYSMLIGSKQRLLVDLGLQDVVEVFRNLKHVG